VSAVDPVPPSLRGLDVDLHLAMPELRQRYVTTMFEIIAPKYDRFTRAFSFGMDAEWKQELVAALRPHVPADARVVDLACGTGDLAVAMGRLAPEGRVVGIDAAPAMIDHARAATLALRRRLPRGALEFRVGDMMDLDLPAASADVVTIGYGLRNVPDFRAALAGIHRVLRPGGLLANLDFTLPEPGWWRAVLLAYLRAMGDVYGLLWHGDAQVYGYIARSIARFVTRRQFADALDDLGFEVLASSSHLGGGVSLHVARRRP
jgi:demethylmenaquinone methyltransferase/2-methoxy-6-polyprenyl-1,4-benzoquinol methylase